MRAAGRPCPEDTTILSIPSLGLAFTAFPSWVPSLGLGGYDVDVPFRDEHPTATAGFSHYGCPEEDSQLSLTCQHHEASFRGVYQL